MRCISPKNISGKLMTREKSRTLTREVNGIAKIKSESLIIWITVDKTGVTRSCCLVSQCQERNEVVWPKYIASDKKRGLTRVASDKREVKMTYSPRVHAAVVHPFVGRRVRQPNSDGELWTHVGRYHSDPWGVKPACSSEDKLRNRCIYTEISTCRSL